MFLIHRVNHLIRKRCPVSASLTLLAVLCWTPASAQTVITPGLSLAETINQLMGPIAPTPVGQAIGLATSLEVATSPLSNSSAGFVFKVDPTTGLRVRTATTFGPSFAERALTSGEGKVSVGVSFTSANYSKLGDLSLDRMQLSSGTGSSPAAARSGLTSLVLLAETL